MCLPALLHSTRAQLPHYCQVSQTMIKEGKPSPSARLHKQTSQKKNNVKNKNKKQNETANLRIKGLLEDEVREFFNSSYRVQSYCLLLLLQKKKKKKKRKANMVVYFDLKFTAAHVEFNEFNEALALGKPVVYFQQCTVINEQQ